MNKNFRYKRRSAQGGSILILAIGLLIILCGFAALAVDLGRMFIVKNELQNAVDAASLAGANCLDKISAASASDCLETKSSSLNWDRAIEKAKNQLTRNSADGAALLNDAGHVIETGYWNLDDNKPSGGSFSETFNPLTLYDKPAVRVTVTKDAGLNGGPIMMMTALMFGGSHAPMSATAVAVLSSPGNVQPASLIPYVINKCMYDKFWDAAAGVPKIYTGTPADPYNASVIGQPWEVRIGSGYHYETCQSGQWTSFDQDTDSLNATKDLIINGNPTPLGIGDAVWIQAGTKAAAYDTLEEKYPPGSEVTVIVVDTQDLSNKGEAPVVAFAGFRINKVVKAGSNDAKYIQGNFIPSLTTPGSSGVGPFYGVYTPPRLAN